MVGCHRARSATLHNASAPIISSRGRGVLAYATMPDDCKLRPLALIWRRGTARQNAGGVLTHPPYPMMHQGFRGLSPYVNQS